MSVSKPATRQVEIQLVEYRHCQLHAVLFSGQSCKTKGVNIITSLKTERCEDGNLHISKTSYILASPRFLFLTQLSKTEKFWSKERWQLFGAVCNPALTAMCCSGCKEHSQDHPICHIFLHTRLETTWRSIIVLISSSSQCVL